MNNYVDTEKKKQYPMFSFQQDDLLKELHLASGAIISI